MLCLGLGWKNLDLTLQWMELLSLGEASALEASRLIQLSGLGLASELDLQQVSGPGWALVQMLF